MCFSILFSCKISENITKNGHFYKKLPMQNPHFLSTNIWRKYHFFGLPSLRDDFSSKFSRFQILKIISVVMSGLWEPLPHNKFNEILKITNLINSHNPLKTKLPTSYIYFFTCILKVLWTADNYFWKYRNAVRSN